VNPREDPHLLSGAYALHALTPEEAAMVEEAMKSSEELRGEIAELTDTAVLLGLAVPPAEPSPDLRARLLAAVDTTPQLPAREAAAAAEPTRTASHVASRRSSPASSARPTRVGAGSGPRGRAAGRSWARRPGMLLAAVAAAAALLFGAGVLVDNVLRPSSSNQAVTWSDVTNASDAQHRTGAIAGGGTVAVYWSDKVGASAIRIDGATAPSGKAMQLWAIEDGKAVSAGLWHPPAGQDYQVLPGAMHKGQTLGITVEPAGGSKQPTSTPVAAIPIT
jgi:anti-sigma-K factor RskA